MMPTLLIDGAAGAATDGAATATNSAMLRKSESDFLPLCIHGDNM